MELPAGDLAVTQLLQDIRALIAEHGPITVEQYMQLALAHPDLGYYMTRDPFGAAGISPPRPRYRRCSAS